MRHIYLILITICLSTAHNVNAQINFTAYLADNAETVKFINLTSHNIENPYILFYWHLGDGIEKFAGNEMDHYYDLPGKYEITLIGIAKNGVRDTLTRSINIPEDLEFLTEEGERLQKRVAQNLANLKNKGFDKKPTKEL